MQLQEDVSLTGIQEGSAGDPFLNLHVLEKNPEQLINDLPAFPDERDQHSRVVPPFLYSVMGQLL